MGCFTSKQFVLEGDDLIEMVETTKLHPDVIKQWYGEFIQDFPRGYFTRNELQDVYSPTFTNVDGSPYDFLDCMFNALDRRKMGVVTFREFAMDIAVTLTGTVEEKLHWAFNVIDSNGDGYITLTELQRIVEALWKLHCEVDETDPRFSSIRRRINRLFRRMDVGQMGYITRNQFVNFFKSDPWVVRNVLQVYSYKMSIQSRIVDDG